MNPTTEQAIIYFGDMANGKPVPTTPGRKKGLGVVQTPYHVTTPTDQALARAYEAVERQKVIRGLNEAKEVIKGPAKSRKRKLAASGQGSKKPKADKYSTPGLN